MTDNVNQAKSDSGPETWKPVGFPSEMVDVREKASTNMVLAANELLLHILQDVDQGQERVRLDHHRCGKDCSDKHVEHLLNAECWRCREWGLGYKK